MNRGMFRVLRSLETNRGMFRTLQMVERMRPQLELVSGTLARYNQLGIASAMDEVQRQSTTIERSLALVDASSYYADLVNTARKLNAMSLRMTPMPITVGQVHPSWLRDLERAAISTDHLEDVVKLTLSDVSYDLSSIAQSMPKVGPVGLSSSKVQAVVAAASKVQRSIPELRASYVTLADSFEDIQDLVEVPSFILPGATRELATASCALEAFYPLEDEAEEAGLGLDSVKEEIEGSDLIGLLEKVGPEFVALYTGAKEALVNRNPDRTRHVLASLRTLWDNLLWTLAPDTDVGDWISERGDNEYLHNEKPTRRARIHYILRDQMDSPLQGVVETDTTAWLELYALCHRLHKLDVGVTDGQLHLVFLRTDYYLDYFLRVWGWPKE